MNADVCEYRNGIGHLSSLWAARDSANWQTLMATREIPGASGLSITVAAQSVFRGRLALRVMYGAYTSQAIEVDIPRVGSIWVPGDNAVIYGRIEAPVDVGDAVSPPPVAADIAINVSVRRAEFSVTRAMQRSFTYVDPGAAQVIRSLIPPGAYAVSPWQDTFAGPAANQTNPALGWLQNAGVFPSDFDALTDLSRMFDNAATVMPSTVHIPAAATHFQVIGGAGASSGKLYTLVYDIQP